MTAAVSVSYLCWSIQSKTCELTAVARRMLQMLLLDLLLLYTCDHFLVKKIISLSNNFFGEIHVKPIYKMSSVMFRVRIRSSPS